MQPWINHRPVCLAGLKLEEAGKCANLHNVVSQLSTIWPVLTAKVQRHELVSKCRTTGSNVQVCELDSWSFLNLGSVRSSLKAAQHKRHVIKEN